MRLNKKYLFIISIVFLFVIIYTLNTSALQVRPMDINLRADRGEKVEFKINLFSEKVQEKVKVKIRTLKQNKNGGFSLEENSSQEPLLDWINISKEITLPPNDPKEVVGEISVPYDAGGTHTAIIIIEPVIEEPERGIAFKLRYAVRVSVDIEAPGLRKDAELVDFNLTSNQDNQPILKANINNPSSLKYRAAGEVTVRNEKKQLIERVAVKSQYAAQAGRDSTMIYPNSEVVFSGKTTELLTAGTYDLQLFLYYADGRQLIERKTVEVGEQFVDPENMDYIEIEPTTISENLRKGGAHTAPINIRNRTGDKIKVKIESKRLRTIYDHSLMDNFKVQFRGNETAVIEGRRSERPVIIFRAPREEITDGGYYDKVQVKVFDPENKELLQKKTIDLAFIVGEEFNYAAEVQDLQVKRVDEEVLFSTTVLNQSDLHFAPQARIYLSQNEEIVETINLDLPEKEEYILPEMTGLLNTHVQNIEAGKYTAEVTIFKEEKEITVREFEIKIGPVEEE